MARQIGSTFRGTRDGLTFYYDRVHGYLVRRTGGVTSKQYRNDARYGAARDASSEFCVVSRSGKLIRDALADFLPAVKDGGMVNRLNRELVALKQLDTQHFRGERRPHVMMADATANARFRIFQFNEAATLYGLTARFPVVSHQRSRIMTDSVALKAGAFPEGATHAGITLVRTVIDFEAGRSVTDSSGMAMVAPGEQARLSIDPGGGNLRGGTELICVQVLFFRKQHGDLVQLKERVHSMGIVFAGRIREATEIEHVPARRRLRRGYGDFRVIPQEKAKGNSGTRPARARSKCFPGGTARRIPAMCGARAPS